MERKQLSKQLLVSVCVSVFALCVATLPAYSQQKTVELKYVTMRGPTEPNATMWQIPMAKEIEKQTNGKVKITHFWSNALGKTAEHFDLVKSGVADMTDYAGSYNPGKFQMTEIGNLPFAAKNPVNIRKAMHKLLEKGYFKNSWGEVEVLAWNITPFYQLLFRKDKPLTFDDLAGRKIRTPGGYMTAFLKDMKAVPITIPPTEAFLAWEKGLVEGWMHPMGAFNIYKLFELKNKSLLKLDAMAMANAAVIINKQKMASLDPETQKIIRKVVLDYEDVYVKAGDYNDKVALTAMEKTGVEIYALPPAEMNKLKRAVLPVWQQYIEDINKTGGDGKAIVREYVNILKSLGEEPIYTP